MSKQQRPHKEQKVKYVYVLGLSGKPIMPTKRLGRVKHLLKEGKARKVSYNPFVIQLLYETPEKYKDLNLGVDPGHEHSAFSVTSADEEYFVEEIIQTTDMSDNLTKRSRLRRSRRTRKLRCREPRFMNRKNRVGKLPPSNEHTRDTILDEARRISKILPIKNAFIETAKYDAQKAMNPEIKGIEYQRGFKYDYDSENIKECVRQRDKYTCQICGAKNTAKEPVTLNVHHILPVSKGGTNTPRNLVTLCENCHKKLHKGEVQYTGDSQAKSLTSIPLSTLNVISKSLAEGFGKLFENVYTTDGIMTKVTRTEAGLEKHHTYDALVISQNVHAKPLEYVLVKKQCRRHNRALHDEKPRKGGKRWKRTCDKYIGKSKLQKYDCVLCNGEVGFIFGKTNNSVYIKTIFEEKMIKTAISVNKVTKLFSIDGGNSLKQLIRRSRLIEYDSKKK